MSAENLLEFLASRNNILDKSILAESVKNEFNLTRDRSVYYCDAFAIRFNQSATRNFGNTVLSLSNLRKFDDRPFFVCLITPFDNFVFLANTTFLKKISHSSQELREDNIRGSFNGSDVERTFEGRANTPENAHWLYNIHSGIGFSGNLARLVEATNGISPTGVKFKPSTQQICKILAAPKRASDFVLSNDFMILKNELDEKVLKFNDQILVAAFIENVNIRGRIIEYLIAGEDKAVRTKIVEVLSGASQEIPQFRTENSLGDYEREFIDYSVQTDVKTKIMILDSNPKAYNLDKVLDFLSSEKSVFMFYFVGIGPGKLVSTALISMFQKQLLGSTILLKHWAGRNSRGVSQFVGKTIGSLIEAPSSDIDEDRGVEFLREILNL